MKPSFIDKVDEEFFEPYGNFSGVRNFNKLLSALLIDEATFDKFFPELGYLKTTKRYSDQLISDLIRDKTRCGRVFCMMVPLVRRIGTRPECGNVQGAPY